MGWILLALALKYLELECVGRHCQNLCRGCICNVIFKKHYFVQMDFAQRALVIFEEIILFMLIPFFCAFRL